MYNWKAKVIVKCMKDFLKNWNVGQRKKSYTNNSSPWNDTFILHLVYSVIFSIKKYKEIQF